MIRKKRRRKIIAQKKKNMNFRRSAVGSRIIARIKIYSIANCFFNQNFAEFLGNTSI